MLQNIYKKLFGSADKKMRWWKKENETTLNLT